MKNQLRLKHLFEKAKSENAPQGSANFSDGTILYGRVIKGRGENKVLIGMKHKRYKILPFIEI